MAEPDIRVLVGVLGGASVSGKSGALITKELTKLAKGIKVNVKIGVDTKYLRSSLQTAINGMKNLKANVGVSGSTSGSSSSSKSSNQSTTKQVSDLQRIAKLTTEINNKQASAAKAYDGTQTGGLKYVEINKQVSSLSNELNQLYATESKRSGKTQLALAQEVSQVDSVRKSYQNLKLAQTTAADPNALAIKKYSNTVGEFLEKIKSTADPSFYKQVENLFNLGANGKYTKGARSYVREFVDFKNEAIATGQMVETLGAKITRVFSEKLGYGIMATFAMQARKALRQIYTNVVELDGALTQISIVTGVSGKALDEFASSAANVAKEVGATVSSIIASTETYARLGYSLKDSLDLSDITAQFANVANISVDEATTSLTSIMKAYGYDPDDMTNVVDMLVKVGQEYAISASELGSALERGGAALSAGGATLEESIALLTAGNAAVQNAETVGNAMKTISARIRGAKSELEEMGEEVDDIILSTSKYRAEIKALSGVDIMVDDSNYKSIYQIMTEIASVYNSLSDINKAQLIEDLAGKRNAQVVASMITNLSDLTGSFEAASNASGTLAEANAKYIASIDGKLNKLSSTYQELSQNILGSGLVKGVLTAVTGLLEALNFVHEKTGGLITLVINLSAVLIILKAVISSVGLTTFGKSIIQTTRNLKVLFGMMKAGVLQAEMLKTANKGLKASLYGIYGVIAAIAIAGLVKLVQHIQAVRNKTEDLTQELNDLQDKLSDVNEEYNTNTERIGELLRLKANGGITLTEEEELKKLRAENALLEAQIANLEELAKIKGQEVDDSAEQDAMSFFAPREGNVNTSKADSAEIAIAKYKKAKEEYDRLLNDPEASQDAIDKARVNMENAASSLGEVMKEVYGIIGNGEYGQKAAKLFDEITLAISGAGAVWDRAFSDTNISNVSSMADKIALVAQEARDSGDYSAFENLLNDEEIQKFLQYLIDLGVFTDEDGNKITSLDQLITKDKLPMLANQFGAVASSASGATKSTTGFTKSIDNIKSISSALNDAMDDFKKYGGLTSETITALNSVLPGFADSLYDSEGNLTGVAKAALTSTGGLTALATAYMETGIKINGMSFSEAKNKLKELEAQFYATSLSATVGGRTMAQAMEISNLKKAISEASAEIASSQSAIAAAVKAALDAATTSSTDKFKAGLEDELKILKHKLEMEKITYEEYYAGVAAIRDKYAAKNATKYEEEIWDLEEEIFSGRLTTLQDFVEDYNNISDDLIGKGNIAEARKTYDAILAETQKSIDWGVKYGLSETGNFMQTVRKQAKETKDAIVSMVNDAFDDFKSYADDFDLWGTGAGKVGISEVDYYKAWLSQLKSMREQDLINYADYVKKYNDIAKKLYDAQKSAMEEIIDLTIDMIKQEKEDQIEALEEEISAYNEIIELKKKALEQTEDELDHQEKVAELTTDIAKLQSQIAILSLDTSREAVAKRISLEEELADKQKELGEEQRSYSVEQTKNALDEEADSFEKEKDKEIEIIKDEIDDFTSLYKKAISMLKSNWDGMYKKLKAYNDEYCNSIDGQNSLKTSWEAATSALTQYKTIAATLSSGSTIGIGVENPIGQGYLSQTPASTDQNNPGVAQTTTKTAYQTTVDSMGAMPNKNLYSGKSGMSKDDVKWLQTYLNNSSNAGLAIDGSFGPKTAAALSSWQSAHGLDPDGSFGPLTREKMKLYHTGGVVGDSPSIRDNEILALLEKGELVLDSKKKSALGMVFDKLSKAATYAAAYRDKMSIPSYGSNSETFAPNVSVNVVHNGTMDDSDAKRYGEIAANATLEKLRTAFNRRGL